jgi:putative sigma-54 modulation protein
MALKVDIFARNMEINERIKEYITKKASKLDRYLNGIDEVRVDLAYVKSARSADDRQVAQITIRGRGFIMRAEERADDLFAAYDTALDKLQRQIERFKGKRSRRGRPETAPTAEMNEAVIEEIEANPEIVRRKQFTLIPMDEMEAIEQMTLLGHENFFVFYNANTSAINVLYRRRDGTYGLIEPLVG